MFHFNSPDTLDGCERRFIYLDLYKKGERKTCDLYDNLKIKHGKSGYFFHVKKDIFMIYSTFAPLIETDDKL